MASIIVTPPQRFVARALITLFSFFLIKWIFWDTKPSTPPGEIAHPAILERIALGVPLSGQSLDTRRNAFLQTRVNRDETPDLFANDIDNGITDFWTRFQKPFALSPDTIHLDEQVVRGAVEELLGFNGWAAAACSALTRPFGTEKSEDDWSDLAHPGHLYYFALVVHGADHFLVDQLAVIIQLSRRLGPNSVFVSLVDYGSTDSTPFICDIAEAVMVLLGISFRIRQVPSMTSDPTASYYPLEEAYTRNLALEPLIELWTRRKLKFSRVIWLKGFVCPNDILESIRVSVVNQAAMVCSMDWKEHNGFFIYNDRWRTRDMDGNLFRGSKSTSPIDEAPPRDALGGARYALHLPFQVFCCESGSHVVDPHKSYYEGLTYQSSVAGVFNTSAMADGKTPRWSEGPCMDSSQLHFCRDMWMVAFREGVRKEAKKLANDERMGKGRNVNPLMEELIQSMQASYAPTASDRVGYANSGDYLADETGPLLQPDTQESPEVGTTETLKEEEDEEEEGDQDDPVHENAGGDGKIEEPVVDQPVVEAIAEEPEKAPVVAPAKEEPKIIAAKPEVLVKEEAAVKEEVPKAAAAKPKAKGKGKGKGKGKKVAEKKPEPVAEEEEVLPEEDLLEDEDEFLDDEEEEEEYDGPLLLERPANAPPILPKGPAAAGVNAPAKPPTPNDDEANKPIAPGVAPPAQKAPAAKRQKRSVKTPRAVDSPRTEDSERHAPRSLPNRQFDYAIAKILVNPRCVTTYAGVSHTQLAMDLFGTGEDKEPAMHEGGKYVLDEWRTAPESFVCQEMRTTGGRIAPKQQRRTGFQQARLLMNGWRPT